MSSKPIFSAIHNRHGAALIVACGAALWGLDGFFRKPLAFHLLPAASLVLAEHAILVVATLPWLLGALRAARKLDVRGWIYLLLIGAGGSAVATVLFTKAFATGDAVTPLVLQQVQPFVVILVAGILLRERMHARYFAFFVVAVVSVWFITFPHPRDISLHGGKVALFSLSAATLWALGTVLGRHLSLHLEFKELTTLRFLIGLPAAFVCVMLDHQARHSIVPPASTFPRLLMLALVTGLIAMLLYYYGLHRTPASVATIAELAFPITATVVGVIWLNSHLNTSQWIGVGVLTTTVAVLSWQSSRHEEKIVDLPDELETAA